MRLRDMIEGAPVRAASGRMDAEVDGLAYDSRLVRPGDAFFALSGRERDGRRFAEQAVEKGASAVIYGGGVCVDYPVPSVCVDDARAALARAAHNFHGRPSDTLEVIGVTGTNGKTTTCCLVRSMLEASGRPAGQIGTIGYMVGAGHRPAPFTTPEAPEFQGLLREMLDEGCTHVVTEVSSHALAQRRADSTRFKAAVFTNLTREHLDYHGSMAEYFAAKRRLFDELLSGTAVVNADDPYGARLAASLQKKVITYGLDSGAELRGTVIESCPSGIKMVMKYRGGLYSVNSPLLGAVNASNILAASAVAFALGLKWDDAARGLEAVTGVPGRFERVELGQDFLVLVDFAHTGDALERAIANVRGLAERRVITVFGCGGRRDRGKRPVMGLAAARLSDRVYITTDNPRDENPGEIINEIVAGIGGDDIDKCAIEPDRAEAVRRAVAEAGPGDVVLIAGKGHEEYQEAGGVRRPFSDRDAARAAIAARLKREEGEGHGA